MTDKFTMQYVEEERDRCAKLVEMLIGEPDFLMHCIAYWIRPDEVETRRARFEEMDSVAAVDNFEDLM